jgi:hypothetical protein
MKYASGKPYTCISYHPKEMPNVKVFAKKIAKNCMPPIL